MSSLLKDLATKYAASLAGLLLVAALVWISWLALATFFGSLIGLDKQIVSSLIAALGAVILAVFAYLRESRLKRQEAHRSKKIEVYSIFFDFISTLMKLAKNGTIDEFLGSQEFVDQMIAFKRGLIFYGSPDVIKCFNRWHLRAGMVQSGQDAISAIGEILLAMRKDVGLSNWALDGTELSQVFVNEPIKTNGIRRSET